MQSPVVFEMKRKSVHSDTIIMRSTSLSFPSNTISKEEFEPTLSVYILTTFTQPDCSGLNKKITHKKIEWTYSTLHTRSRY